MTLAGACDSSQRPFSDRLGWEQTAAVSLAHSNACILWEVPVNGADFDADCVSMKPTAPKRFCTRRR